MFVRDIMRKDLITVSPGTSIKDAAARMKDEKVGCVLIVEDGRLKGILTDRDIACFVVGEGRDPLKTRVDEIMNTDLIFSKADIDVFEASRIMAERGVRRLPIQSNGRLEGIVSVSDLAPILKKEVDNFLHLEEIYHH